MHLILVSDSHYICSMKKIILCLVCVVCLITGCITNDLPYPKVIPNITAIDAVGSENITIDTENQLVTIQFSEVVDLRKVEIRSLTIDSDIAVVDDIIGVNDLTSPLKLKITTYDDYVWTIKAVRNVERYFNVMGQIGATVIDEVNCRAITTVSTNVDLKKVEVTSLKLGPEGISKYSLTTSQMRDFTYGVTVDVTAFDETETWNLFVEQTDARVSITKINPWATEVYVTSLGVAGMDNGFRYRVKGSQEWIDVQDSDINSDGGSFVAHIKNLKPKTLYEIVAFCGSDLTSVEEFTTDAATPIPNGSFEYASKVAGKDFYKFYDPDCGVTDGSYMFWGSGNGEGSEGVNGSANMGIVITHIDTSDKVHGKQSVLAQTSQMAGILAAGNLFTGQFAGLVGTSGGKVNFGRPWTSRPKAIKVYCKYITGKMDIVKSAPPGVTLVKGETYDCAELKIALGYWDYKSYGGTKDSPVHVNTTDPSTFVDFNTDKSTIANANLTLHHNGYVLNGASMVSASTDQWVEYTIPLNYRDMDTLPTHIIISCASSKYGDYFSGYSSSKLWLDKMELVYE